MVKSDIFINDYNVMDKIIFVDKNDGYSVKSFDRNISGELEIPYYYNGKNVISIESSGFTKCRFLTSVIIKARVSIIPYGAFMGCCKLTRFVVPSSVKRINYAGICLYDYDIQIGTRHICDVIFEEKSELEYIDDYGLSYGNIRVFFCSAVDALIHHNAYASGKVTLFSPVSFKLNNTLQSKNTLYCYPKIYPNDFKCVSIRITNKCSLSAFIYIIFLCFK